MPTYRQCTKNQVGQTGPATTFLTVMGVLKNGRGSRFRPFLAKEKGFCFTSIPHRQVKSLFLCSKAGTVHF